MTNAQITERRVLVYRGVALGRDGEVVWRCSEYRYAWRNAILDAERYIGTEKFAFLIADCFAEYAPLRTAVQSLSGPMDRFAARITCAKEG